MAVRLKNQKGQGLIEYIILVALVAIGSIALVRSVGQNINVKFAQIIRSMGGTVEGSPSASSVSEASYRKKDLRNFMQGSSGRNDSANSD